MKRPSDVSSSQSIVSAEAPLATVELPPGRLLVAVTALIMGLLLIYRRRYPGLTPIILGVIGVAAVGALSWSMGAAAGNIPD